MPLMPAREPRPEPLARARARLEFDALVRRRSTALQQRTNPPAPSDTLALLDALARSFADAVDQENSTRGILRTGIAVDYVDAVVLTGQDGALVVDATDYENAPVHYAARVGDVDSVIRGRDLDGYLRTGDTRYAEQLGLPT